MTPDDLLAPLRARPFAPFRVVTSEGAAFDVRHPDMAVVGHATAVIAAPAADGSEACGDFVVVALRDISRLEPITAAP